MPIEAFFLKKAWQEDGKPMAFERLKLIVSRAEEIQMEQMDIAIANFIGMPIDEFRKMKNGEIEGIG